MTLREWSKYEIEYGRKLMDSGLDGARSGGHEFLEGKPFTPFLRDAARNALGFAAAGACIGLMQGRKKTGLKALAFGVCGGAIGFGVGMAWSNRRLAASVASAAWKKVGRVRDEHWLELHPIDYA